ncbi:MAG: hypothetical protein JNL23_02885 [Chitinophagaceae bacterium]|nr:hypothetical protein [Chitinophagaceae bacterium]
MDDKPKKKYRLDRDAFKMSTVEEAANHYGFWKNKSMKERLDAAFYLIQQAYGINNKTLLDKAVFSKRKHHA